MLPVDILVVVDEKQQANVCEQGHWRGGLMVDAGLFGIYSKCARRIMERQFAIWLSF